MSRNLREGRYAGYCARHLRTLSAVAGPTAFDAFCLRAERENFVAVPRRYYIDKASIEKLRAKLLAACDRARGLNE